MPISLNAQEIIEEIRRELRLELSVEVSDPYFDSLPKIRVVAVLKLGDDVISASEGSAELPR